MIQASLLRRAAFGALIGAASILPLIGMLFLGRQLAGFPFPPFDLFDWLARSLPGALTTAFIDGTVRAIRALELGQTSEVANSIEELVALGIMVVIGAVLGAGIAIAQQGRQRLGLKAGALAGGILFLVVVLIEANRGELEQLGTVLWLAMMSLAWGAILGSLIDYSFARRRVMSPTAVVGGPRRVFLVRLAGGAVGLALVSWGLGRFLEHQREGTGAGQPLPSALLPSPASVGQGSPAGQPAPGTRAAVTSNLDFYTVDIDLRPRVIMGSVWQLEVKGLFSQARPLSLQDLMSYDPVTQPVTLCCISNPVGGDLIGNAYWTGLRLRDLVASLSLLPEATDLLVEAADGFHESVPMADFMDSRTLLVYGMNGMSLPLEHGFPLRILIPNRYGMKQPKWITRITALNRETEGYWVARGWSKEARPQIMSTIDTVAEDNAVGDAVPVGGVAWAGDRGIAKVELRVDKGQWQPAILLPAIGPLTWRQWRYDWPRAAGRHTFTVRATDGLGTLQIERQAEPHPNGATGYHEVAVIV